MNLVLISVVLINFFYPSFRKTGFFSAGIGGIFLDLFGGAWLGVNFVILLVVALMVQELSKLLKPQDPISFSLILIPSLIIFNLFLGIANWGTSFILIRFNILAELLYNLGGGLICFYLVLGMSQIKSWFLRI